MSGRLFCVRECVRRGHHLTACEDQDTCKGCEPRQAAIGQLCIRCHGQLTEAIARVPDLISHIRAHVEPGAARRNDMVKGTRTPPAPLALDAVDAADKLYAVLSAWHDTACTELDLSRIPRYGWATQASGGQIAGLQAGGRGNDSATIAERLTRHLERICQYEWAGDMTTELSEVAHVALRRWPMEEQPMYLPTPCPSCDMLSLVRYAPQSFEGTSVITCRSCRESIAEDLYDWQTRRVLIEKQNEAEEAAAALDADDAEDEAGAA